MNTNNPVPLTAALKPAEVTKQLLLYGFTGLVLKAAEERKFTYSFVNVNVALLKSKLGAPSVASGGKVLVFHAPKLGRLGVSPASHMLRFVDETTGEKVSTSQEHLSGISALLPEALRAAYVVAAASPSKRVTFLERCWDWANKELFDGKMDRPLLVTSATSPYPKLKTARGVYTGGRGFTPGTLWIWGRLFNAELPFFLDVLVHEMCHQAAWTVSKSTDRSEGGHGPVWQGWMRKVGLDPRRYDSTESVEYEDSREAQLKEVSLTKQYGPRSDPKKLGLTPWTAKPVAGHEYVIHYQGRLFKGTWKGKNFTGVNYTDAKITIALNYKSTYPDMWLPD